jgi:hypothetical protein
MPDPTAAKLDAPASLPDAPPVLLACHHLSALFVFRDGHRGPIHHMLTERRRIWCGSCGWQDPMGDAGAHDVSDAGAGQ